MYGRMMALLSAIHAPCIGAIVLSAAAIGANVQGIGILSDVIIAVTIGMLVLLWIRTRRMCAAHRKMLIIATILFVFTIPVHAFITDARGNPQCIAGVSLRYAYWRLFVDIDGPFGGWLH